MLLYVPVLIFKGVIYGKSDWHWYTVYDVDKEAIENVKNCAECNESRLFYLLGVDIYTKFSFALITTSLMFASVYLLRKNPSRIFKYFFLVLYLLGFSCNIMLQYQLSYGWSNNFFQTYPSLILYLALLNPFMFEAQNPLLDSYNWSNAYV